MVTRPQWQNGIRMRASFQRIAVTAILALTFAGSAHGYGYDVNYEANRARWSRLYELFASTGFEALDGSSRCAMVAAARMGDHNQEAFVLAHKLTDADWAALDQDLSLPDQTFSAGIAILSAAIYEVRGDHAKVRAFCNRGMTIIEEDRDRMESDEQSAIPSLISALQGLVGAVGVKEVYGDEGITAEAQDGEKTRAQSSGEAAPTDATDSAKANAVVDEPSPDENNGSGSWIHELVEKSVKDAKQAQAGVADTLLMSASDIYCAYFSYQRANVEVFLGNSDVYSMYFHATHQDRHCDVFRRLFLEHQAAHDGWENAQKALKDLAKEEGKEDANVNGALFINECYFGAGQFDKVISEDTKFLSKNANHSLALGQRARAYCALKDFTHASADADAALAADEFNFDAWYVRGVVAQAAADPKAREYFEKAITLSPWTLSIHAQAEEAWKALR